MLSGASGCRGSLHDAKGHRLFLTFLLFLMPTRNQLFRCRDAGRHEEPLAGVLDRVDADGVLDQVDADGVLIE